MENRRKDFRHRFDAGERIEVVLSPKRRIDVKLSSPDHPEIRAGQIHNLSLHGMLIVLAKNLPPLAIKESVLTCFILPKTGDRLTIEAVVVRTQVISGETYYGCQFIPLAYREDQQKREKLLWQYLLNEQRRQSRVHQQQRQKRE